MSREKDPAFDDEKALRQDISPVLKGWHYKSGAITVRKIAGADGEPKIQMRLDLGVLQMELKGRPDGVHPHGCESLLDYFERELDGHKTRNGTELGFHLTSDQCQSLREEAVMYYHRYLGLFALKDFGGVVRDTARNLRVLDLCGKYAVEDQDRLVLEQYRPYIIMMNTRAQASIHFKKRDYAGALRAVDAGIQSIRDFFARFGQDDAFEESSEVRSLIKFSDEIRRKLPVDPLARLTRDLEQAIETERYEEAARLRDEIKKRAVE
jgi:hypothetical protein